MNKLIPVTLQVTKLSVLIVGFGNVGKRKYTKYHAAGATVTTIDPTAKEVDYPMDFASYYKKHGIHFMKQHLVIICTDDPKANEYIAQVCERFAKLYNRTDEGSASCFTDMVTYQDDYSLLGISSNEQSPYISKHLLATFKPLLESDQVRKELAWLSEQTKKSKKNHETYEDVMIRWRLEHDR